ncbi:ATP-dependent RNA helicase DDX18-like isoform X1 [Haemaphysalis longicornis]
MACTRRCRDVACLGSGGGSKVAFCPYIAQMLSTLCLDGLRGTVCVLVSPTKELAIKSYEVIKDVVLKGTAISGAYLVCGSPARKDADVATRGYNILVATPAKFLAVMKMSSWNLWYQNLRVVVFEEIGRLGDGSFAKDLKEILSLLPRLPRLQTRAENGSTHEDSHGAGEEKSGCPVQDMCRPAACGAPLPGHDHLRLCRPQVTRDCRASLRLLSVHGTAIGGHCWPLTRCPSFSSWIQCTPPCVHPATWRRLPTRCFLYSVYLASSSFCKLLGAR